jgi:hypothetical protein
MCVFVTLAIASNVQRATRRYWVMMEGNPGFMTAVKAVWEIHFGMSADGQLADPEFITFFNEFAAAAAAVPKVVRHWSAWVRGFVGSWVRGFVGSRVHVFEGSALWCRVPPLSPVSPLMSPVSPVSAFHLPVDFVANWRGVSKCADRSG